MSARQEPSGDGRRTRWSSVAAGAWAALMSAVVAAESVELARLVDLQRTSVRSDFLSARLDSLARGAGELERRIDAINRQPQPAARSDLEALGRVLEDRLSRIEQARAADARADDVQALQARVNAIDAGLKRASSSAVAPARKSVEATTTKPPEPPFVIVGLELRGDERFLSIRPLHSHSLADARLLHAGEADGAWRLQTIGDHEAIFEVDGQARRLAIP